MREDRVIVVFRNDDPSGTSDAAHERRVVEVFKRYGVPQTLGVIPLCAVGPLHDPTARGEVSLGDNRGMVEWLRGYATASGSEIALHGFTHRTNRLSIPSRREYFEFRELGLGQQADWIARGAAILERTLGVRPCTFIPPWNRLDVNTVHACAKNGIAIISAGPFAPIQDGVVSFGTDCDLSDFPSLLAQALRSDRRVFLRVLYHSRSTRTPEELAALEHAVRLAVQTPQCQVLTIRETVRRFPDQVRLVNEAGRNIVSQTELRNSIRARVVVYRRVAQRFGLARKLEALYCQAKDDYCCGDYQRVQGISTKLDGLCVRVLVGGRASAALLAFASMFVLAGACWGLAAPARAVWYGAAELGLVVLGLAAQRGATAVDTKRELRFATLCALIAAAGGLGAAELLFR